MIRTTRCPGPSRSSAPANQPHERNTLQKKKKIICSVCDIDFDIHTTEITLQFSL